MTLKFQNHYKKLPVPFIVYADFECITKPISTCETDPHDSFIQNYQKHEPSGFYLYLKGLDGINKLYNPILYTIMSRLIFVFLAMILIVSEFLPVKRYLKRNLRKFDSKSNDPLYFLWGKQNLREFDSKSNDPPYLYFFWGKQNLREFDSKSNNYPL